MHHSHAGPTALSAALGSFASRREYRYRHDWFPERNQCSSVGLMTQGPSKGPDAIVTAVPDGWDLAPPTPASHPAPLFLLRGGKQMKNRRVVTRKRGVIPGCCAPGPDSHMAVDALGRSWPEAAELPSTVEPNSRRNPAVANQARQRATDGRADRGGVIRRQESLAHT